MRDGPTLPDIMALLAAVSLHPWWPAICGTQNLNLCSGRVMRRSGIAGQADILSGLLIAYRLRNRPGKPDRRAKSSSNDIHNPLLSLTWTPIANTP